MARLRAGDFTHPTSWGADKLGNWIYAALMEKYEEYRKREGETSPTFQ
jgi:hypothetical protein